MTCLLLILNLMVSITSRMLYKRDDSSIFLFESSNKNFLYFITEYKFVERYFIRIRSPPFLISLICVKMVLTFMKDVFYISWEDYMIFHLYSATVVDYRLNLNIRPFVYSKSCHSSLCCFIHSINCHIKLVLF